MAKAMLMLTYHINTLQELPEGAPPVMETLNRDHDPAPGSVLAELSFQHPMYSRAAVGAQARLGEIQGADRLWFAGAWTRYGFHEDGLLSAVRVAEALGAPLPWAEELDASRTLMRRGAPVPMLGQVRELLKGEPPVATDDEPPYGAAAAVTVG